MRTLVHTPCKTELPADTRRLFFDPLAVDIALIGDRRPSSLPTADPNHIVDRQNEDHAVPACAVSVRGGVPEPRVHSPPGPGRVVVGFCPDFGRFCGGKTTFLGNIA